MLGVASFAALAPILLGGLYGGMIADRISRHRLSLTTQFSAMCVTAVLAGLTLFELVQVWQLLVLATLLGVTQAFGLPARHALVAQLVPRDELPNAIALHSAVFNGARFVGPAASGWLVVALGEGWVFLFNAFSYLVFLFVVSQVRLSSAASADSQERVARGTTLALLKHDVKVRNAVFVAGLAGFLGAPYLALMPVFAAEVYSGGAETLGLLTSAAGAGSLLGALALAHRTRYAGLRVHVGITALASASALVAFGFASEIGLALALLAVLGCTLTYVVTGANTLVQLQIPDRCRGRAVALFSVVYLGSSPLGSLAAGAIAEVAGVRATIIGCGILLASGAGTYLKSVSRQESAHHRLESTG
jgi:MFS family permease